MRQACPRRWRRCRPGWQSVSSITIRRARPDDAEAVVACLSHPAVARGLLQLPYGSAEFWRKRIADMPQGTADIMLVAEVGGAVVGNAGLIPAAQQRRRHAANLGISVLPEAQGQGVGSALMAALLDYADRWAGLLRVELNVFTDNAAAIALYKKFSFVHEGTSRAYALRDGQYADVHFMARLHPKPPVLP
jgi:L-phenylalanine/L-methionine N-acetyltransferase